MMEDARGLECLWGNINQHPQCPHGPTLLFGRYVNDKLEQFYACSACRDRKLCKFYLKHGEKLTKVQQNVWDQKKKEFSSQFKHRKLYIRFNEIMGESPEKRAYCHKCEKLILISEKSSHEDHEITEGLTDHQMHHPTEILKPLSDAKKEAQYLFTEKAVEDIVNMLIKTEAKEILCIGTPKIHEYILEHHEGQINSLLLDFDGRFHNFFGPLNYCWYNLFNHHFFSKEAENIFKDFLTQNGGKDMYLICDPPFGGRVEAMSLTLKMITDLHKKWNKITDDNDNLKIIFIFPYFMESIMREKSNPPDVQGGLKDLKMTDYKVDYINHPLFIAEAKGRKFGSPVRIFTNISLNLLELPESDGYKYCKKCKRWVSAENKHCKKCKACTSKDGRTYKHCNTCERCVKPTWNHCNTCNRCTLEKHVCNKIPKTTGRCYKCNKYGHTAKDCHLTNGSENTQKKTQKRKSTEDQSKARSSKKQKLEEEEEEEEEEDTKTKKKKKRRKLKHPENVKNECE